MGDACRIGDEFTRRDLAQALTWYTLAAEQGHAEAQNNLATMYCNAVGFAADFKEAVRWYRAAAEQGLAVPRAKHT